jgi:uncharacterized protein (DUF433 family)/DNA-binding transcriptional MerR regulator
MPVGTDTARSGRAEGRGWYLAREAGWLAGVSGDQIGQWARRDYIRSSRSDQSPRVYSFQDVAEAMVVHELLELGLRPREIRRAVRNLRDEYGDWPLTSAPLAVTQLHTGNTRGAELLVLAKESGELVNIAKGEGNEGFLGLVWYLRYLSTLLKKGGWVIKDHPDIDSIEVDPDRLGGIPTIRNRRVPAEKVAVLADSPGGRETLRDDYDLSDQEIDDAVAWYRAVTERSAA